jgi:hypothetical protein
MLASQVGWNTDACNQGTVSDADATASQNGFEHRELSLGECVGRSGLTAGEEQSRLTHIGEWTTLVQVRHPVAEEPDVLPLAKRGLERRPTLFVSARRRVSDLQVQALTGGLGFCGVVEK